MTTAPEDLARRVLYRDAHVLVIDKPAGFAVHRGPGGGPNLEGLLDTLRFGYKERPELGHRLDRDTSGCLALGRNRKGLARLGALFREGKVEKFYWAVVANSPPVDEGTIDRPLRKITRRDGWHMAIDPQGHHAVTHWRVLGRGEGMSWLECRPATGRTHQIRVHAASLGCPILGDKQYGRAGEVWSRGHLMLHARRLVLPLKEGMPPVDVTAAPPPHMRAALSACGWREEASGAAPLRLSGASSGAA
jgi:RluA family pseudouridine synthase